MALPLFLVLLLLPPAGEASPSAGPSRDLAGTPLLQTFTQSSHAVRGHEATVVQGHDGLLYLNDMNRVLEYDGVRFTPMDIPPGAYYDVALDTRGRLWVCGYNRIGYFEPRNERGVRPYVSLEHVVLDSVENIVVPFQILPDDDGGVWMRGNKQFLHINKDGELTRYDRVYEEMFQATLRDERGLLMHIRPIGIHELRGDSLVLLAGTESIADHYYLRSLVRLGGDSLLIGSEDRGIYLYDGQETRELDWPLAHHAESNGLMNMIRLDDGRLVISTYRGGVLVGDLEGRLLQVIDRSYGLTVDHAYGRMSLDGEGGLWVATTEGLNRIQVTDGITRFSDPHGLVGTGNNVLRRGRDLWFGNLSGLFHAHANPDSSGPDHFRPVADVHGSVVAVHELDGTIYLATNVKLHRIIPEENRAVDVRPQPWIAAMDAAADARTNRLLVHGVEMMYVLEPDGDGLEVIRSIEIVERNLSRWIGIQPGTTTVWWLREAGDEGDLRLARFDYMTVPATVDSLPDYSPGRGLAETGPFTPFFRNDTLHIAFNDRILRYDAALDSFVLAPELTTVMPNGNGSLHDAMTDSSGRIYLWYGASGFGRIGTGSDGQLRFEALPNPNRAGQVRGVTVEQDGGAIWASMEDGSVIRIDPNRPASDPQLSAPLVRQVRVLAEYRGGETDTVVYGAAEAGDLRGDGLPYRLNSMRFEYALPTFRSVERNRYRTRLVGFNTAWSAWTDETYRDFTGLAEGNYVFEIQGRDADGRLSPVGSFPFFVTPPWYRTGWAFALWSLLALLMFYGTLRLREIEGRRHRQRLEAIIAQRTEQLRVSQEEETRLALEAERLDTTNKLAITVAHEFNNPLAIIQGMSEMMLNHSKLDSEDEHRVERIREQVVRMSGHVKRLLDLQELRDVPYAHGSSIIDLHREADSPASSDESQDEDERPASSR